MTSDFTAREVGVLVEDLKSDFRVVAEGLGALRTDMDEVKERLGGVEERLISVETRLVAVEDVVGASIPDLAKRVTRLELKAGFK